MFCQRYTVTYKLLVRIDFWLKYVWDIPVHFVLFSTILNSKELFR